LIVKPRLKKWKKPLASDAFFRTVDLHTHSTASDGTLSPLALVRHAADLGLAALALTDHDTMAGVREVLDAGLALEMDFLPGVEISARPPDGMGITESLHILGYGMDPDAQGLVRMLEDLQEARENRNPRMVERLCALGFDLSFEDVVARSDGGLVGRPHMARVLVEKGFVKDMDTAFSRYLGKGRPAYVEKDLVLWEDAIREIRKAGGIAVLAHPGLIREVDRFGLFALLKRLKEGGLGGVEVYYPKHGAQFMADLDGFCWRLSLLRTGGSDFHGDLRENAALGTGHVPYSVYADLMEALGKG
jgi:predicted metal-dependent phosphoesterase TrpH